MTPESWWAQSAQDVRYALRQLRRSPGFTSVAVATLALGIGANSAVFSVINGVLIRPLPYPEPGRLVSVTSAFPSMDFSRFWISPPEYFELREWNRVFEEIGGYRTRPSSIETYDRPVRVPAAIATWSFFPALGVQPALGRTYGEGDDLPGAAPVAVISDGLWRRAFDSDPGVVGETVRLDGVATTILGVMPAGFDIEDAGVDVWTPMSIDPADHENRRANHFLNVVARLGDGVTLDRAQAELDRLEARWEEEYPETHHPSADNHPFRAIAFHEDVVGDVRPTLLLLLGAVAFVLLIACANVASLLLARSETRAKEVAVRVALGASRRRLARQLLTEGITLSLIGGAAGVMLGQYALSALLRINPDGVPRTNEIALNGTVLVFAVGVSLIAGLLFGLAPLLQTDLPSLRAAVQSGVRTTRGSGSRRTQEALVVGEVALAAVLLTGAGLMLRSMGELRTVDLGFQPDDLLTLQVNVPEADYPETSDVGAYFAEALSRIRALPGVEAATTMSGLPPLRVLNANDTEFEGVEQREDAPAHNVDYWTAIETDFVETLGVRVLEGRGFEPADALAETPVMLVNERLSRTFYPDQSALGRRIRPPGAEAWFTVVGVVADMKQAGVGSDAGTELFFYSPQISQSGQFVYRTQSLLIRADRDPLSLATSVLRTLEEIDPTLPVSDVQTMEQNLAVSLAQPRFTTLLLSLFATVALLLAAVGTYGVMGQTVAQRTRDIGIRMALGARRPEVLWMILRQGGTLAALGLGLGVAGSLGLARLLTSQLFEVGPTDPAALVLPPLFLAAVATLACYVPARRATRVQPMIALQEE